MFETTLKDLGQKRSRSFLCLLSGVAILVSACGNRGSESTEDSNPRIEEWSDISLKQRETSSTPQSGSPSSDQILNACTYLTVDRGGPHPIQGANLKEVLSPIFEKYATTWEVADGGYILRASRVHQLTGNQQNMALEFSVPRRRTSEVYCGPLIASLSQASLDGELVPAATIGNMIYRMYMQTDKYRAVENSTNSSATAKTKSIEQTVSADDDDMNMQIYVPIDTNQTQDDEMLEGIGEPIPTE